MIDNKRVVMNNRRILWLDDIMMGKYLIKAVIVVSLSFNARIVQ